MAPAGAATSPIPPQFHLEKEDVIKRSTPAISSQNSTKHSLIRLLLLNIFFTWSRKRCQFEHSVRSLLLNQLHHLLFVGRRRRRRRGRRSILGCRRTNLLEDRRRFVDGPRLVRGLADPEIPHQRMLPVKVHVGQSQQVRGSRFAGTTIHVGGDETVRILKQKNI